MLITIELDDHPSDSEYYEKLTSEYLLNKGVFKCDPLGVGVDKHFYIHSAECKIESWGGPTRVITMKSCGKPKSVQQLAAEESVRLAKEALKAAEESLKVIKEGKQ